MRLNWLRGLASLPISDLERAYRNSTLDEPVLAATLQNDELVKRLVCPVDVDICNLTVGYRPGDLRTRWQRLRPEIKMRRHDLKYARPQLFSTKTILDDVSAYMMACGTLTATYPRTTLLNTIA